MNAQGAPTANAGAQAAPRLASAEAIPFSSHSSNDSPARPAEPTRRKSPIPGVLPRTATGGGVTGCVMALETD